MGLHYSHGANLSDAMAMTVDDVKVASACPGEWQNVRNFVTRSDTMSLTSGLTSSASVRVVEEVCKGNTAKAQALSVTFRRNIANRTAGSNGNGIAKAAQPTLDPRSNSPGNAGVPPQPPASPRVESLPEPEPTPVPSNDEPKPAFFESTKELAQSVGLSRPEIDPAEMEARVHQLINVERTEHGLKPLDYEDKIAAIARNHSLDMAKNDYFSHDNLRGQDSTERGKAAGYECIKRYPGYYTFGLAENIYQGWLFSSTTYINGVPIRDWNSLEDIAVNAVQGWMESQGHRENILEKSYDRAGIGVAIAEDGKVFITQNFC